MLRRAKDAGLHVTASASINHLALNEIDVGHYRTFFKMSPPLRNEDDRKALVAAVEEGLIDVVMSDHNPQDVEVKRLPFAEAAPGAIGIETMLPAGLRLVHNGELKLMTLLKALSTRPAELLGLAGGSLAAGRAGRCGGDRSGRALGARPRRAEIEMPQHAVRRGPDAGPRRAHHRRRPDGVRIRVIISPLGGTQWTHFTSSSRLIIGYLLGSIPFGLILTRLAGSGDIRSVGSGNIGATNVLRTGRKGLAAATLARRHAQGHRRGPADAENRRHRPGAGRGLRAVLGHVFPVWLNFKGGKGVATYIGVLIAVSWPVALSFAIIWAMVAALSRYSSLAGLIASAATPVLLWIFVRGNAAWVFAILTALVWIMHRGNISRLMAGTEPKIGKSAAASKN